MRRRSKQTRTPEERLADRASIAREDVEKLPSGKERDALLDKIRETETAIQVDRFLKA
jgi:hypothetical protein